MKMTLAADREMGAFVNTNMYAFVHLYYVHYKWFNVPLPYLIGARTACLYI